MDGALDTEPAAFNPIKQALDHRAVSGEGITYYPRQNGGAWKADSDGFESNCPVSTVHELAIVTHVISNNATTCIEQ